jgi:hypothetical protein
VVEAEITTAGLKIDRVVIAATAQALNAALGKPSRELQIPLHGGQLRRIRVFDDLGLAYYLDETPPEIPSVVFILFPDDAPLPFQITRGFDGSLRVNDTILTSELIAAKLPTAGALRFEPVFGYKWRAVTPTFSVWLSLRRRRNRVGKLTGEPRLADVSICYGDP